VNFTRRLLYHCRKRPEVGGGEVFRSRCGRGEEINHLRSYRDTNLDFLDEHPAAHRLSFQASIDAPAQIPSISPHSSLSILLPRIVSCSRFVRKSVATENHVITFTSGKRFGLFGTGLRCLEEKTTRQRRRF
jgi:hypothetical protein